MTALVLNHDDVAAALAPGECEQAMSAALTALARGEAHVPLRMVTAPPGAAGLMGQMPAWRGGERPTFAVKSLCLIPGNPARGLDTHQGTVTLFDGDTGVPTAILDASAITAIRTAAVTAVATRRLARANSSVLAILGAGVQAQAHLRALLALAFDWREVRVFAPTREHAQALARLDSRGRAAASAREALHDADVVVTVTSSREPVLARQWLAPGAHVNAVGASTPDARELDTETVAECALYCDSRESLTHEAGDYLGALGQGREVQLRGELGEVLIGAAPGRRDDREVTVFRSLGLAVEDLAAAELAVDRARAAGLGVQVAL